MAEQGGYRRPSSPAPVSGPGAMSRRTDGQPAQYMAGGEYGEGQEMMDVQTSAPMSRTETMPSGRRGGGSAGMPLMDESESLVPLFDATQRPDEPITAGADFGPGPGPSQSMARPTSAYAALSQMYSADGSAEALAELAYRLGV